MCEGFRARRHVPHTEVGSNRRAYEEIVFTCLLMVLHELSNSHLTVACESRMAQGISRLRERVVSTLKQIEQLRTAKLLELFLCNVPKPNYYASLLRRNLYLNVTNPEKTDMLVRVAS